MITVVYHSADFDGIFCREIARKFLGDKDVQYLGWNFGDPPVDGPAYGHMDREIIVMDLPLDGPFGLKFQDGWAVQPEVGGQIQQVQPLDRIDFSNMVWIDHHKSSIESHPASIPGYRIDGVAACRLAWAWFSLRMHKVKGLGCTLIEPTKQEFIDRKVQEPLAVRLAGEYDIWDKRDPRAETFQYALRVIDPTPTQWDGILSEHPCADDAVERWLKSGEAAQRYAQRNDASICNSLTWLMEWEGQNWLCVNHARFNSNLFAAKDVPETGHDALLGFRFDGKKWLVSMYHAAHRKDLDLSQIAVKYGGGGHRGACGFTCVSLPFMKSP